MFNLQIHAELQLCLEYMTEHIERDQLSQKIKIYFLLFPKWLFFLLNFDAKFFEIGYCILETW